MSDEWRINLQLAANVLGVGFVIVIGTMQVADYFTDKRWRHIFAALAWFVLVPVLVLRTAGIFRPPLLEPQVIADGASIGWAVCLTFAIFWGVLRILEKRQEDAARKRLGLEEEKK